MAIKHLAESVTAAAVGFDQSTTLGKMRKELYNLNRIRQLRFESFHFSRSSSKLSTNSGCYKIIDMKTS